MKMILPLSSILFFTFSLFVTQGVKAQATATITPSETTLLTGGSVDFQVITTGFGANNNNRSFAYSVSGPAPVTPSPANFNCTDGCNDETHSIQFNTAGEYTVSVTVTQTQGGSSVATSSSVTITVVAPNTWACTNSGTRISSYALNSGAFQAGPVEIFTPDGGSTAALAMSLPQGSPATPYFYWLPNASGNNGVVSVYGATVTGGSQTLIGTLDVNGASSNSLGFVRLGMGPDGWCYLLAGDGTNVYLAGFKPQGVTLNSALPVSDKLQIIDNDGISLTGGTASEFQNGDLAVLSDPIGGGVNIFALANVTGGATKMFVGKPNGNSSSFTKKWDLVTPSNTPFTGSVNGVSFDQPGNMYLTTSGTGGGIYFVDAASVNAAAGTVITTQVLVASGLTDLATNSFPANSPLPVTLTQFSAALNNDLASIQWKVEAESDFSHYEVERSHDGNRSFEKIAVVKSAGDQNGRASYQVTDDLKNVSGSAFVYRLKMVDNNGTYRYSNTVVLRKDITSLKGIRLSPNPVVNKSATLQLESPIAGTVQIRITDMTGKIALQQQTQIAQGINNISVQQLDKLNHGNYIMQVILNGEMKHIKLIVGQ
jgi:hypothetical protein